ncbi:MAG: NAD(P)H-quinone oxidoreductase [Sphingobacterium composti]|uniref:NAD(P)H-quinone oxidoreductase n=1 Tax=Sphingobacterium composti TaxID=363260 RepID=UPI0013582046|nr:NAD(P)H-quinone oxidoreductase [Sphingobacterium composti Ten et al. 2007 non Yoo et al. 2007]
MKAIVISEFGGPEVLVVQEREEPTITEYEILVRVKAAGINRPDVFQRQGKYPAPQNVVQDIPGLEVSGIVEKVGDKVIGIEVGQRVMALVSGGGYAEYVNVHYGSVIPLPENISYEVGATLPETVYTVWHNLFQRGKLEVGERVLIHGGAGGIGSTAIQLAKLFGAYVITTVSTREKEDFVRSLGADQVINYKEEDFESLLHSSKADVILDYIGGGYFDKNINVLNEDGRLIYINAMEGSKVELNLFKLMQKRITLTGSTLRNRSLEFKKDLTNEIVKKVLPLIESKRLTSPIFKEFSFKDAKNAHLLMESGEFLGKLVLVL